MVDRESPSPARRPNARALSAPTMAVVLLVVILVVGGLGYAGLRAAGPNSVSRTSCAPAGSPACAQYSNLHDISVTAPFKAVQQGNLVPFTARLPPGEFASSYTFNFGDGSSQSSASPTLAHAYTGVGTYLVSVTAIVSGATHDNFRDLLPVSVSTSYQSNLAGNAPGVAGSIVSNGTAQAGATGVLAPGGSMTVSGSYASAPTNPEFVPVKPTLNVSSGGTLGTVGQTNTSASGTATFSAPGVYEITFVGSAVGPGGTAYQNYTWTAFVAPPGVSAGLAGGGQAVSPHKNSLIIYEYFPGGSQSEDPAIDYETVGYEPMTNVYQTLIGYNGSQTGPTWSSYVPEIATCVPGSPQCQALYGSTLISPDGNNFTFVISGDPQFYDPATGAHWGVWPTDVLFSVARTMGFSVLPCLGCNNGWILAQSLLDGPSGGSHPGNVSWDGGIHSALNNTPNNVYAAVTINDTSAGCPTSRLASTDHGCVTFHATGSGHSWPYFLELIADGEGGSIVPCGWFSAPAQGAGIPDWTAGAVSGSGDRPCAAPGAPGWGVPPSAISPTAWDSWENAGSVPPFVGNVQWNMVGSGPYYLKSIRPGSDYMLAANPAYAANSQCTWAGCMPQPGHYAASVAVTWETSQVPGEQAYAAGAADLASIPPTDAALLMQLVQQGKIGATTFPSLSTYFFPFNFAFNERGTSAYTSNPVTVPSDWFSYVGLRQFLAHAYPYQTIEQTVNTKEGIQYYFDYGGAIPQFMANYYPTNVSFPSGDPCTDASSPACAAYWWHAITDPSNTTYYDPEAAACSAAKPCEFPLFGQTGAPDLDQRMALWAASVAHLTGGAVLMDPVDINFVQLVINSLYSSAYGNPMPVYTLGWAPDYPDPTDYVVAMYQRDSSYTFADTVGEQTDLPAFNASGCPSFTQFTWYSSHPIPNDCQGAAYGALQLAMKLAAVAPAGPGRVLLYDEVEQIANSLALYVYWAQTNIVESYAAWINPTSLNSNVTIGGGQVNTWYTVDGNGVW